MSVSFSTSTSFGLRGGLREPLSRDELVAKCRADLAFAGLGDDAAQYVTRFADDIFDNDRAFSAALLRLLT